MKSRAIAETHTDRESGVTISKLSVVILSYNTKNTTVKCIRSLIQHSPTTAKLEVIVIDNASADGSPEVIAKAFPDVKLIRNARNRGFAAACNQGIRSTNGEVVLLLNSDTELIDQSLDIMLDFITRNSDVGIAGGKLIGEDGKPQNSCQHFPTYSNLFFTKQSLLTSIKTFRRGYNKYRSIPNAVTDVDALAGGFMFLRREALKQIGLLDERFFFYVEDLDISKRMSEAGWRVVFVPQAKVLHVGGKSTALRPAKCYWWHHKSLYRYFAKHNRGFFLLNWLLGLGLVGHFFFWWLFRKLGLSKNGTK
jgi:GT2 family glycosyltransferase